MSMISFNPAANPPANTRSASDFHRPGVGEPASAPRLDTLDLSPAAQERPIRQDLVARMRAAIASGQYERDLEVKLDTVADRILDTFNQRS